MSEWGELPTANPEGSSLGADDVQLHRRDPHPGSITSGVIEQAWELVKEKPFETLFLAFLSLLFGGGGGSCGNPFSGLNNSGGDYNNQYNDDYQYDYGGSIFDSFTHSAGDLFGVSGVELGLILGIVVFVFVISIVFWVLGALVQGATYIFWLRLIRGQDTNLNHVTKSAKFLLPIMLTQLIMGFAVLGGYLLLIIPGIILSYGWMFVIQTVIDKNITYVEALKVSWRLTDGHKVDLFVLTILFFFVYVAGILACCVGVILSMAIIQGSLAIVYNRLAEPGNAYLNVGEDVSQVFE